MNSKKFAALRFVHSELSHSLLVNRSVFSEQIPYQLRDSRKRKRPIASSHFLFDRAGYKPACVEGVLGFCMEAEYFEFLDSSPEFE